MENKKYFNESISDEENRFEVIKKAASEIKEYIELINCSSIVKTDEDMFIELELYD